MAGGEPVGHPAWRTTRIALPPGRIGWGRAGPVMVELNVGTAEFTTGVCVEMTPGQARAVAAALLDVAATPGAQPGILRRAADD